MVEATGIKGFAAFSNGYSIVAEKRYKDGSYGYDKEDIPLRVKEYPG